MCENEKTAAVKLEYSADMSMDVGNHWVKTKGRSLGYAIIIRRSRKEENGFISEVVLMCNHGGIDKSKNLTTDKTSKKINCPFQLVGKYSLWECGWTLQVICEKHNHEPALDMEGHPHAMRLSNKEYRLVVKLFMNGLKPRAILSILKERHPDDLSTIKTIYNALQKFTKPGNADMVNDQETVSLSPESNPYAFDAKRMKRNVDHTAPFATELDAVVIAVSAEDEPTLGRPFQLYRDVAFYKPKGQFSNDSLSMDVEKRMNAQYNTNFTHSMCENETTAAVKSGFSADMSMHVGNHMNTQYNTNFTHTVSEIEANCAVNGTSEFSTNMVFKSHKDLTDWVKTKGRSLGYVIVIRRSKKEANGVMSEALDMGGHPYAMDYLDKEKSFGGNKIEEDGLQSDVNFDIWNEMNKSMDIEDESDSQYNTSFTQTVCENERTHAVNGTSEFSTNMV
ncbi:FAR1-related sequence 5-like protein [Tanacetum coccineum]